MGCTAAEIISLLGLRPHPEGGHFRETFRDAALPREQGRVGSARAASTAIYFLLSRGERSHWHRVDAAEVWHYYAGAPLILEIADTDDGPIRRLRLGADFSAGERPQVVVPRRAWQAAESLGDWTLVGCTVAPGFEFAGFELAPQGWAPSPRNAITLCLS
jgi:predicted cupin superfamily sugar epimerase